MPQPTKIPYPQALQLWNNFTSIHSGIVPFSFNPSLFNFYKTHFNWKPYYILIFSRGELCGVFPLVNTGKAWVSLPHFSYGGILHRNAKESYNIEKIIGGISIKEPGYYRIDEDERLNDISVQSKNIFIRSLLESASENAIASEKVTSVINLPDSPDEMMKMISSNLRRKIRKAESSDINIKIGGKELMSDFYKVYSRNIQQLNSLNYSISFFADLCNSWEYGDANFFVAYADEKPIGASMLLSYMGFYENVFFATNSQARKSYVSDFLHWEMINYCITQKSTLHLQLTNHASVYSFGRSTIDSGVYDYKNHWPVNNYPLYNYTNISDLRKNDWMLKIWGLLPGTVTKPLGARLIRHLY